MLYLVQSKQARTYVISREGPTLSNVALSVELAKPITVWFCAVQMRPLPGQVNLEM